MADLYKNNISFLESKNYKYFEMLNNPSYTYKDLEIVKKEEQFKVKSKYTECFLHSTYSIEREMEKILGEEPTTKNTILFVFGLGMGHLPEYIEKNNIKFKYVLYIEPYINIFDQFLRERDLRQIFTQENVSIIIADKADNFMETFFALIQESIDIRFIYHISYRTVFKEFYNNLYDIFKREMNAYVSRLATGERFIIEWNKQQVLSINRNYPMASSLYSKFMNVPGVIVSGGPSVKKQQELLKNIGDKAVIAAPGSGNIRALEGGIEQHISVTIDSQEINKNFYQTYPGKGILLGSTRLHPAVFDTFPNQILQLCLNNEFLSMYLYKFLDIKITPENDFSTVACTTLQFLQLMGCNPIILVGQDMSDNAKVSDMHFEHKDIFGQTVYATRSFLVMQRDMMVLCDTLYQGTEVKILNATEGGIGIPGVENVTFASVYEQYIKNRDNDVRSILGDVINKELKGSGYTREDAIRFYKSILSDMNQIDLINKERLLQINNILEMQKNNVNKNRIRYNVNELKKFTDKINKIAFYNEVILKSFENQVELFTARSKYISQFTDKEENYTISREFHLAGMVDKYISEVRPVVENELKKLTIGG